MISHPLSTWKGFRTFATLSLTSSDLSRRTGLVFRSSHDDLDELRESAFSAPSGSVFGLIEHMHAPVRGVEVLAHESTLSAGTHWPILEVLSTLGLDRDSVQWSLQPSVDDAHGTKRTVCVIGRKLSYFRPDVLEIVQRKIVGAGFQLVAPWEDIELEARVSDHVQLVQGCDFVLYLASDAGPWSYYDLGIARACQKPILALGPKAGWTRDKTFPHFDRELLLADPHDTHALRAMLDTLIEDCLAVPRTPLKKDAPRTGYRGYIAFSARRSAYQRARSRVFRMLDWLAKGLHGQPK